MTTTRATVERSGPAIRAALAQCAAPAEREQFEAEFRQALAEAAGEFDLAPVEAVLNRWWRITVLRANPLSEHEQAQLARARGGIFDGLWERDESGRWVRL